MQVWPGSAPLTVAHLDGGGGGGGGGGLVEHGGFDSSPNRLICPMYLRCDRLQSMELVPAVTPSI